MNRKTYLTWRPHNPDTMNEPGQGTPSKIDEFESLKRIVDCLRPLDDDAKVHLLKSAITFLRLDMRMGESRSITETVAPAMGQTAPVSSFSVRTEMSPKQFLNEKKPANDIERVACLAYYLTHFRNTPEFKTLDISKINTEAAQPKFSNPSVPMDHATRRGYLVATSGWSKQLGAIGEQFVQALPDRDAARLVFERVRMRKSRKKRSDSSDTGTDDATGNEQA